MLCTCGHPEAAHRDESGHSIPCVVDDCDCPAYWGKEDYEALFEEG